MEISVYAFGGGYHIMIFGTMHKVLVNTVIPTENIPKIPPEYPDKAVIGALLEALKKENWK